MDEYGMQPLRQTVRTKSTIFTEVKTMPNIKSAKKRVLVTEAKTLRNKIFKTQLKTDIKKYNAALEAGDAAAAQAANVDVMSFNPTALKSSVVLR